MVRAGGGRLQVRELRLQHIYNVCCFALEREKKGRLLHRDREYGQVCCFVIDIYESTGPTIKLMV